MIASGLGLFIGFFMALTGAGGAIVAIPLLMFLLKLSIHQAAPIALMAVFIVSITATVIGINQGIVRYKAATLLAFTGIIAAPIGVNLAMITPPVILQSLFIMVLLYVAWRVLRTKLANEELCANNATPCEINPATSKLFWTASCTKRLILTGGLAGFLSGLLGVGGGFIVVPSMQKISNLQHRMIVATALAMVALVSLVSVVAYARHAQILWAIALPFTLASLIGSLAGRPISNKIASDTKHLIFGAMALVIASSMLLRLIFKI